MYAWIWRKLPFGKPGKVIGSLILAGGIGVLLWFVAFPQLSQTLTPTQSTVDPGGDETEESEEPSENPDNDSDRVTDDPDDYETEQSPGEGEEESSPG